MLYRIAQFIARSNDPASRFVRNGAKSILHAESGLANEPGFNGEYWLLDRLASGSPITVFDVGANRGEWSKAVLKRFPRAEIHAFEIVPETHRLLSGNLSGSAIVNGFGLGATDGEITVNVTPGNDLVASTIPMPELRGGGGEPMTLPIRRGANYCREKGVNHISILKIDVEGAEHHVLDGFGSIQPDLIQWEMGQANASTRVLLKDYYARLPDYAIAKLTREGVTFRPYHPALEGFELSNWVAVRRQTLWEKTLA